MIESSSILAALSNRDRMTIFEMLKKPFVNGRGIAIGASQRPQPALDFSPRAQAARGSLRVGQRLHELVVAVREHELEDAVNRRISNIVEYDDAARFEEPVREEKVDQRVVERMPSVDERE